MDDHSIEICWYCQKNEKSDPASFVFKLRKLVKVDEDATTITTGTLRTDVEILRCDSCRKIHDAYFDEYRNPKDEFGMKVMAPVLVFGVIVSFILYFIPSYKLYIRSLFPEKGPLVLIYYAFYGAWWSNVIFSFLLFAALGILLGYILSSVFKEQEGIEYKKNWIKEKGIEPIGKLYDHPQVVLALKEGYSGGESEEITKDFRHWGWYK